VVIKKSRQSLAFAFLLTLLPAACALSAEESLSPAPTSPKPQPTPAVERLEFKFPDGPGQNWTRVHEHTEKNGDRIEEYVPAAANLDNWQEMLTVQTFPSLRGKTNSQKFMEALINRLPNKKLLRSQILSLPHGSGEKDQYIEWSIDAGPQAQHELDRIITGSQGIYVLHYCARPQMNTQARSQWLELIKQARLAN
jgi:hypothetical protein